MAGLKVFDGSSWRAVGVEDSQWDVLTAVTNPDSVSLSWPTAGGSPTSYEIDIDGTIIDVGNVTSYERTGLTANQQYRFKVRPKYSDGSTGGWTFFKDRTPLGFNNATGGTVTEISNYNGTGQTWRVHTFTSNGTFVVNNSVIPFRVLWAGAGGQGGRNWEWRNAGGGGAGGYVHNENTTISATSHTVTVGSTSGWGDSANGGSNGGNTVAFGVTAYGGGGGGGRHNPNGKNGASGGGHGDFSGGNDGSQGLAVYGSQGNNGSPRNTGQPGHGGGAGGAAGSSPGPGVVNNISGTNETYCAGGWGVFDTQAGHGTGRPGSSNGCVIISYRIA